VASNSSRVWVESDPIGPDKERDLPAPGSNSSVARIEKGEGMVQGSIGAGPAVSKPASFGALKAVETDGRSIVTAFPSFLQARS
jgi:hypothetical protein